MKDKGRKLSNRDIEYIVKDVVDHGQKARYIAGLYGVSPRRVEQLAKQYREHGVPPKLKKRGRKPTRTYPNYLGPLILSLHQRYGLSAAPMGHLLRTRYGLKIDNNKVNEIMKEMGISRDEPNKRVRKKDWIRYERHHSLSAVHMDWYYNPILEQWVCAVLDDASRKVLGIIETEHPTTEASIKVLDEAYHRYLWLKPIDSVIVDHGSQFYANKRDEDGNAEHRFERYCKENNIQLILCRYNHPQSNGKIERFYQTYQRHRHRFVSAEEFVEWYNTVRPHMSLDLDNMETPEKAFYRKAQDIILGNFMRLVEKDVENDQEVR